MADDASSISSAIRWISCPGKTGSPSSPSYGKSTAPGTPRPAARPFRPSKMGSWGRKYAAIGQIWRRQAVAHDAADACGGRTAIRRLRGRRGPGRRRPAHWGNPHGADLRRRARRLELHLRACKLDADASHLDRRPCARSSRPCSSSSDGCSGDYATEPFCSLADVKAAIADLMIRLAKMIDGISFHC